MQFTTQIPIPKSNDPIDYNSRIVSLGSCFAENIGEKFDYFKFQNSVNPFGIIFNPVSIEKLISRIVNQKYYTDEDVFFNNELWHCFEVHSELSNPNKEAFLENLNEILLQTKDILSNATHIIITYGTSWAYRYKNSDTIVANCHKVKQNQFEKVLLSAEVIEEAIQNTLDLIHKINPDCSIIFTISPVRHIKDGFVENQRSKAHLITAIHKIINHQSSVNYFPSYEIVMDELRDYRFYAEDMLHPNQVAIDYIWERFFHTQILESSYPIMEEVSSIQKGLAHRPFNPDTESHKDFEKKIIEKRDKLLQLYPFMKF